MNPLAKRRQRKPSETDRGGITIVETLVTIGVFAVLLAIILPAVANSRATARRVQCQNNLHQIGIALHNFVDAYGVFPTSISPNVLATADEPSGLHERLLPMLGADYAARSKREQLQGVRVPVYLCPDDPVADADAGFVLSTNYLQNNGVGFSVHTPFTGFGINLYKDVKPRDFNDGLSNTVAISERLRAFHGDGFTEISEKNPRVFWWTEERFYGRDQVTQAIEQARFHRTTPMPQSIRTSPSHYDHMLPPNHASSYNGPDAPGADADHLLIPASSLHQAVVNSLLADGSCRTVSSDIDLIVWHALGTRSGGEVVPD